MKKKKKILFCIRNLKNKKIEKKKLVRKEMRFDLSYER